ncbi:MAG: hypothetical protein IT371_24550 [Deltaproteobacteria bacterium]|nr:hypothetical protein [Deltaproteobacteria bacterium]
MRLATLRSGCVLALLSLSCRAGLAPPAGPQLNPDRVADGKLVEPPGPRYPDGPGKEALRDWATNCFERGLRHSPVFARGGTVVVAWSADRRGDLLQLEFPADSFRGWEIDAQGETLADCIVRKARQGSVRWSRTGTAPLRFRGTSDGAPAADGGAPSPRASDGSGS